MRLYKLGNNANSSRLWNPDGDVHDGVSLSVDSAGNFAVYLSTNGTSWGYSLPVVAALANNQWYHLALVRSGGFVFAFVNGTKYTVTTALGTNALYTGTTHARVIGGQAGVNRGLNGYVDEFRFTKSVARYTAAFTPDVVAHPNASLVDPTVPARVTSYTYDAAGRVLTETDPLNATTTYAYYASTSFTGTDPDAVGHTVGDLHTVTNAAGHVTEFTSYDKAGRVLQTVDPSSVVTDITYTPRGWVNTVAVTAPGLTARTTGYTYDAAGQLTGVSMPDGSAVSYTYDDAHRLMGAKDAKGNEVVYTLDNMGNRVSEEVKDPTGVLQRTISRSFDALNRLQQTTGAPQ